MTTLTRKETAAKLHGLYLVTDQEGRLLERVADAAAAGICALQFRHKSGTSQEKISLGRKLRQLCREHSILFIVNDDPELALELDADGVHLGQEDGDPATIRRRLPPQMILGVSTHNLAEADAAESAGADYIGFGAMYPTGSKEILHLPGVELLAAVRQEIGIPIVAIGGINRDNAAPVIDAGADAVAVISAVLAHPEPGLAASELQLLFNRRNSFPKGTVLTVAGSDSGGGAGIQADLKVITLLGIYGASVITALTAQNTLGVSGIHPVPAAFVAYQLEAVLSDIPIDVVKTGMLFSAPIIAEVAAKLAAHGRKILVVDPVMIAKGGASLINDTAVRSFRELLLPLTYLLTPNIPEAEALTGNSIIDEQGMHDALLQLHALGARNILLKGGHLAGENAIDLLFDGTTVHRFVSPRINTPNTHGTGCSLASAVSAYLAGGEPLIQAVQKGKLFITEAIRQARPLGQGHGPVNHFAAALALRTKEI